MKSEIEWIPCSERLPDYNGAYVLIAIRMNDGYTNDKERRELFNDKWEFAVDTAWYNPDRPYIPPC